MEHIKQDMPPVGGFKSVQYERVPLKKYLPATKKWLLLAGCMAVGWYGYYLDRKRLKYLEVEKKAAELSIYPMLMAEHDRILLRTCRKLRDEEAEIMKDVKGWEVGKYKGEPVFKTVRPDEWYEIDIPTAAYPHMDRNKYIWATRFAFWY